MEEELVEKRKIALAGFLKKKQNYIAYILLAIIAWLGYKIRTKNLGALIDPTSGQYIPADPDAMGILRYVQYVVENGALMEIDYLRYYPTGFTNLEEFQVLSHILAYFYKILHLFNSTITVQYADVIYPAVAFSIALIFFFLMLKRIFDWKVAILASAFLTVLPPYLFRTMAGVSDKEALAMVFVYLIIYLFISAFMEKRFKRAIAYSITSGIFLGILWAIWGGVSFIVTTIGSLAIIMVLLDRMDKKNFTLYTVFLATTVLTLRIAFPIRADPQSLLTSANSGLLFFAFALTLTQYLLFHKDLLKIKNKIKIPYFFVSGGLVIGLATLAIIAIYGPSFIWDRIAYVYVDLIEPFGRTRWALTVAESRQPYFTDLISQFSWRFLLLTFAGAVLLFFETVKKLGKKYSYKLTIAFAAFIIAFSMSRYSSSASIFNGTSNLSILVYIGSLIAFTIYILYTVFMLYTKDKEKYKVLTRAPLGFLFMLLFLVFLIIGARSAVRLIFLFAPITAILAAYAIIRVGHYANKAKEKLLRYAVYLTLTILVFVMLSAFSASTIAQAESVGLGYHLQWQQSMDWVRQNTAEDAVFAHWWDYGYYVQYGGERATLSDGGNAHPAINHFIGRHLLTGENETEALELLAAKEATHVLIISDEIGKYSAFSSIGADENYDRYSWIPTFTLDLEQTHQVEEVTNLVYSGGTALDDDFVYNNVTYKANEAGIAGFIVPVIFDESGNLQQVQQPTAVLMAGSDFIQVPMSCVFYNNQEFIFDRSGLDSCLQIIPTFSGEEANYIGSALYLSHDVWNTVFTHLYLFGEDWEYIKEVYTDEEAVPLSVYNGRVIGPLKIWEVSYPDNLNIPEEYYGEEIPEEVTQV